MSKRGHRDGLARTSEWVFALIKSKRESTACSGRSRISQSGGGGGVGGAPTPDGGQLFFYQFFLKTARNWNKMVQRGAGTRPLRSPKDPLLTCEPDLSCCTIWITISWGPKKKKRPHFVFTFKQCKLALEITCVQVEVVFLTCNERHKSVLIILIRKSSLTQFPLVLWQREFVKLKFTEIKMRKAVRVYGLGIFHFI